MQMLVADGLLDRGRGRSASVRSFTAEDAVDLYRLRRPVELTAVELVVKQRRSLEGIEAAARDVAFHREVFVAAGSPRLLRTFEEISTELRLLIAQLRPSYASIADLAREHELLVATARTGKATTAKPAWSEHFDHSEQFFLNLIRDRDL